MEYENFGYDFMYRTRQLLEIESDIHNKYNVTHLLNYCFGMITIPSETLIDYIPEIDLSNVTYGGISKSCFKRSQRWDFSTETYVDDYTLKNVIKHIRNGISHGNIQQSTDGGDQIVSIIITDKYKGVKNFEIKFTPTELTMFCKFFVDNLLIDYLLSKM